MSAPDPSLASVLAGEAGAVSRAVTVAAAGGRPAEELLRAVSSARRRCHRIGITGPPGAGKSTLIGALLARLRERGEKAAVVACDPASPVTGGAFLGDRMRMGLAGKADPGLFVRSLAAPPGGALPEGALRALRVLEAAGFDRVVVETVGAGQCDASLPGRVDTAVVVLSPGNGDEYQAMKAGMLESADILVVNRADAPEAAAFAAALVEEVAARARGRRPPVVRTIATRGEGIDELLAVLDAHRAVVLATGARAGDGASVGRTVEKGEGKGQMEEER